MGHQSTDGFYLDSNKETVGLVSLLGSTDYSDVGSI